MNSPLIWEAQSREIAITETDQGLAIVTKGPPIAGAQTTYYYLTDQDRLDLLHGLRIWSIKMSRKLPQGPYCSYCRGPWDDAHKLHWKCPHAPKP